MLLGLSAFIEAKDGGNDKKKKKDDKKPAKMVKAKALKADVKDGQWPPATGSAIDFLVEDANHEFMQKWQPFADKASAAIGPKTQNLFVSKDLCTAEFPCNTITNVSTATMTKDATGEAKPEPIPSKKMDKFLKHLSKQKTVKLTHTIHKELLFGGEVHHGGVIARLTAFKKKEVDAQQAVGMVFDAWKMSAFSKKPSAIRAVLVKTDDRPVDLQSVCMFPKGSNKAQADNFCRGRDKQDEEKKGKKGGEDGGDDEKGGDGEGKKESKGKKGKKCDSEEEESGEGKEKSKKKGSGKKGKKDDGGADDSEGDDSKKGTSKKKGKEAVTNFSHMAIVKDMWEKGKLPSQQKKTEDKPLKHKADGKKSSDSEEKESKNEGKADGEEGDDESSGEKRPKRKSSKGDGEGKKTTTMTEKITVEQSEPKSDVSGSDRSSKKEKSSDGDSIDESSESNPEDKEKSSSKDENSKKKSDAAKEPQGDKPSDGTDKVIKEQTMLEESKSGDDSKASSSGRSKRGIEYAGHDAVLNLARRGLDLDFGAMEDMQPRLRKRDAVPSHETTITALRARHAALRKQPTTLRKRQNMDPLQDPKQKKPSFSAFGNSVQNTASPSAPQTFDDGQLAAAGNSPAFDGPGKSDFSGAGPGAGVDTGGDPSMDQPVAGGDGGGGGGGGSGDGAMRRRNAPTAQEVLLYRRQAFDAAQAAESGSHLLFAIETELTLPFRASFGSSMAR